MCGIFGAIGPITKNISKSQVSLKMIETLKRRGPDNSDFIELKNGFIGHTRLSLVDLTASGNQPMKSDKGNIISFNGEIYNHKELLKKFDIKPKSSSDTEILLLLIEKIGFEKTLSNLTGMFSIAYYSPSKEILFLSRDRMGEKPLYYHHLNGSIVFASDLKAIVCSNLIDIKISNQAVSQYFKYSYINAPNSIYENIKKLFPGEMIKIKFSDNIISKFEKFFWFNLDETFSQKKKNLNYLDIVNSSHKLILDSVKSQTFADAKVGSFLSGGIDSSLITAIMAKEMNKVETFTIGSSDKRYDESKYAESFANHLGTSHNYLYFDEIDFELHLNNVAEAFSEPLADSSQIATSIISSLASKKVKAVLTGDGGDELFGGYYRYGLGLKTWKNFKRIGLKSIVNAFLHSLEIYSPDFIFDTISKFGINNGRDKIRKIKFLNQITNLENYYLYLSSNSFEGESSYLTKNNLQKIRLKKTNNLSDEAQLCLWDQENYLPGDNLAKIDRMTMFYSLEARSPFLDKNLVTFMNSIDYKFKSKYGSKSILKRIHSEYFPSKLTNLPKRGFSIPLDKIMKTKLKDWSYYWLTYNEHNFFDVSNISKLWDKNLSGMNFTPDLWKIICFNRWYYFHVKNTA
tara:strand:- start:1278 stop:3167 length:1890 start_codon:yes stop_codon:yes gene_type:complete